MKDKDKDIKKFMEQMNLQKNYYYIILEDVGDDKFKMNAYEVFNFGMSEVAFNYSSRRMFGEILDETGEKIEYKDNIIKVDFGSKH